MAKAATPYRKNCARKHHAQGSVASAQVRRENSVSRAVWGGDANGRVTLEVTVVLFV
jgi:hypothetical protein